jgi:RNA polymerase sigma-70 factor, ECF subfamily
MMMMRIGDPEAAARSDARKALMDDAAFDALYRESVADVHGYALSLLGDRASAEEVTALAFERLLRARRRLDPRRGSPRALLFTIARNAALDELRRRRRRPQAEVELAAVPSAVAGDTEQVERRESVRAALLALQPRDREIVLLKFHGQLTNAELARAMGISESNAGTRLHRALERLRESPLGAREVA